ncbi:MarR family winged helix-turn-helix transcriptional regulator [Arthrobacter sp. 92]|uniref:MarR family winged helix-turn-helix transcriptional regulator n=1 Tax=Arthrobacter sp. 92 TaxID=3418175 RepID=UPI003D059715
MAHSENAEHSAAPRTVSLGGSEVDSVVRAANVLLRVAAQSVAEVEDVVTTPQLRVLVLIANRGPQNPGAVAVELGVHPSNATRTCDRLVQAGLIERGEDPQDRRLSKLVLTAKGTKLVEQVMSHRREAIAAVLEHLPEQARKSLAEAMNAFVNASGETETEDGRFALALHR